MLLFCFVSFFFFGGGGGGEGCRAQEAGFLQLAGLHFCNATSLWKRDVLHAIDYHTATPSILLVLL